MIGSNRIFYSSLTFDIKKAKTNYDYKPFSFKHLSIFIKSTNECNLNLQKKGGNINRIETKNYMIFPKLSYLTTYATYLAIHSAVPSNISGL